MTLASVKPLPFVSHDGGRAAAGYDRLADDCVARSIAIALQRDYQEVCDELDYGALFLERKGWERSHPTRGGILTGRRWFQIYMREYLGLKWHATMGIGSGCKVHMRVGEIPKRGAFVVRLSQHYTAVVDGTVFDTYDPCRQGLRCVYGWWHK